jgi:hypothetical protein
MFLVSAAALGLAACGGSKTDSANGKPEQSVIAKIFSKPKQVVTLPAGTAITVRTTSSISTKTATSGDAFSANLAEPLVVDGKEVAPKGADVQGAVANADDGGRVKGVATLSLRLTKLEIRGDDVPVDTRLFVKSAPATKKNDAIKVGIGAGIGAAIGAIAGGGEGAGIGAASGAGAGTAVVLATHGDPAVVAAESVITFRLSAPLTVELD